MEVSNTPHFMVPQMDAADLRGPFLIGSLVPRPQKVQKGVILGGYPTMAPFLDPIWTPPFWEPLGAPGGGGAIWVPFKACIGPCRPPMGPLRALIGRSPGGSWTMYGVSNTPILMVPQMDAADLRGPFLIGSLVPRPQKVQKRGHFRGYPKWPFLDPIWTPPLLGPLGAPGGGGAIWVPLRPV